MREIKCFVHIPRTGGSTLDVILKNNYGKGFLRVDPNGEMPEEVELNKIECISGHFNYGFANKLFPDCKIKYITILRNPVDRILSWYYYKNRYRECPIEEWLWDNLNKKGYQAINPISEQLLRNDYDIIMPSYIGIFECYDLSLKYFREVGLIKNIEYKKKQNTFESNHHGDTKPVESEKTLNLIREICYKDIELYNSGKKLFFMSLLEVRR